MRIQHAFTLLVGVVLTSPVVAVEPCQQPASQQEQVAEPTFGKHLETGRNLWRESRYEDAVKELRKAIRLQPDSSEAHVLLGYCQHDLNKYAECVVSLKKAAELGADKQWGVHYWQANALAVLRRNQDAVQGFSKALQLAPDDLRPLKPRGSAYDQLGKRELAIADWNRWLAANPLDMQTRLSRGEALRLTGKLKRALQDFHALVGLDPKRPVHFVYR